MRKFFVVVALVAFSFSSVYAKDKAEKKDTKPAADVKAADVKATDTKAVVSKPAGDEQVLAEVNSAKITMADFNNELASVPANYKAMINANKKKFLDDLVLQELLAQEAKKQGLEKDKDVVQALAKIENKLLAQKLLEKEVLEKVNVTDEEAKKYYDEHKDEFKVPEQVQASHILVAVKETATDDEKKAAETKAEDLLKQLKGGADFATLAKDNSDCPSKAKGGDLGYFSKGQVVPEFEEAAYSLKVEELSGAVKTQFGYHIIKVTDKKAEQQKSFDEVKDELKQKLARDKQKTAFDTYSAELKGKAKITINEDLLK